MNAFKQIVFSNIWISLGATIYALISFKIAHLTPNYTYLVLVFFATLFAYNLQRLVRVSTFENNPSERQQWLVRNKRMILRITLISFLAAIVISFFTFSLEEYLLLLPAFVVVLFYASVFFGDKLWGLRDIPFLKILLISSIWAYVLGVFPLYNTDVNLWYVFAEKFCYIMAITIPFDIRDMYVDEDNKTLPQILGVPISRVLSLILLLSSAVILVQFLHVEIGIGLVLFYGISAMALFFSKPANSELYFSGLVDGLLVLSFIIFV